jgi:hypothetical protein
MVGDRGMTSNAQVEAMRPVDVDEQIKLQLPGRACISSGENYRFATAAETEAIHVFGRAQASVTEYIYIYQRKY